MKVFQLYQNFGLIKQVYNNCSYTRGFQLLDAFHEAENKVKKADDEKAKIFNKYAEEDENGEKKIPEDKQEVANKEFQKMLNSEITFSKPLRFIEKDFEGSGIELTDVALLYRIGFVAKSASRSNTGSKKKGGK